MFVYFKTNKTVKTFMIISYQCVCCYTNQLGLIQWLPICYQLLKGQYRFKMTCYQYITESHDLTLSFTYNGQLFILWKSSLSAGITLLPIRDRVKVGYQYVGSYQKHLQRSYDYKCLYYYADLNNSLQSMFATNPYFIFKVCYQRPFTHNCLLYMLL